MSKVACFFGGDFVYGTYCTSWGGWVGYVYEAEKKNGKDFIAFNQSMPEASVDDVARIWQSEMDNRNAEVAVVCLSRLSMLSKNEENDSYYLDEKTIPAVEELMTQMKAKTNVLWVGVVPALAVKINDDLKTRSTINNALEELNKKYAEIADKLDIAYLDVFKHLFSDGEWRDSLEKSGGFLPVDSGYKRIANIFHKWFDWRYWMDDLKKDEEIEAHKKLYSKNNSFPYTPPPVR